MKKLFTLLTLLVAIVTGAQAATTEIARLTITGKTTCTVTGSIGGTGAVNNLGSSSPYKLNSDGAYVAITLADGNYFAAGDIVTADCSKKCLIYYGTAGSGTQLGETSSPSGGVVTYTLPSSLPANTSTIYIYRTSSSYNGTLTYMSVSRDVPDVAPTTVSFSPENGSIGGADNITITSTNAATIYYQWTETEIEPSSWESATASNGAITIQAPNESGTQYLYAYGSNTNGSSNVFHTSYSITKQVLAANLSYTKTTYKIYSDATSFDAPAVNNPNNLTGITYSLTGDTGVASVDENSGAVTLLGGLGTVTITASSPAQGDYEAGSASYTLTVEEKPTLTAVTDKFWKFSDAAWNNMGTLSETTIIDNMEVLADGSNTASLSSGTQVIDDITFTKWFNFGQVKAGGRQLHIKVAGNTKITLYLKAGGSGRKIKVTKDSKDGEVVGTEQEVSSTAAPYTFEYTGSADADLYMFNSGSSSLNFYGVKVESLISDPVFTITPTELEVGGTATISGPEGLAYSAVIKEGAATDVVSIEGATISALKAGTTTVTISSEATSAYNAYSHDFEITVTGVKTETTMAFDNPTTNVELNGTVQNVATLTGGPEGATITYASSDETVATVAADGTVTGKKIGGTATITASYAGNDEYKASEASYEISVVAPALVAVDDYTWNCVDWLTTPGAGDIKTTKWIDNMEAVGTSTNYITIASGSSKTHPDFSEGFNVRVKTNGTSTEDARFFHFIVKPNTKISVYAIRSTNDGGTFALATGSRTNEAAAHTFEADGIEKLEYVYTGTENTDVYVYSKENGISFLAFKVAPYEVIVLDESGSNATAIAANVGEGKKVYVDRTLSNSYYNTLFLPFAMSAEQIQAAFGEGVQVATFTGMNSETQFGFGNVTAMEANVPYLVKPQATVNGFTVEGVTISNTAAAGVVDGGYSMVGTYDEFTNGSASSGGLVIGGLGGSSSSSYEIYYFTTSNTIKKLKTDGTGKIKGLRSFMVKLPSGKTSVETIVSNAGITFDGGGSGDARARQDFVLYLDDDNTTTGIEAIENGQLTIDNDAPAYNLAGQKVGKGYKGIVIINGKKVVK